MNSGWFGFFIGFMLGVAVIGVLMHLFGLDNIMDSRYCTDFARDFILHANGTWTCKP